MRKVTATVVRVTGTCNAGYRVGDKIVINRESHKASKAQGCCVQSVYLTY
jgi:uncharacterized repeat protein (TIGR04076 family)